MTEKRFDKSCNDGTEYADCPLCLSPEKKIVYHLEDPFRVARCRKCGFHFLDPRLDEDRMAACYESDYFSNGQVGYMDYSLQEEPLRLTFRRLLKTLHARGITGGALLEIGAGYGFLLDEARDYFSFRVGTELSESASRHAARVADLLVHGGVDDLDRDSRFDCIVMSQVIEHVYQPGAFLEKVRAHLLPGGRVIIITPDYGSIWRHVLGTRWPSFKVPEHVLFFDLTSLTRLLHAAGFDAVSSLPYPHAFPLKLVAAKLKMSLPAWSEAINVWLPGTCVAVCARMYE